MLLELVWCRASVTCAIFLSRSSLACHANLLGDDGGVRVKERREKWPWENQNCRKHTAASHSKSQRRCSPVKQWIITVCLCSVRMCVHFYIGGMCDLNASFWHFLVCLYKCVYVTIGFCILPCRCWLALKRPVGCCFAVSHRADMSCSFHTRASSLHGGPIGLLSPC